MRRAFTLLAAVAVAGAVGLAGPAHAAPTGGSDLRGAVTAALLTRAAVTPGVAADAADRTQVNVTRQAGGAWAFGTAVITAPAEAYPYGWLFLARHESAGWRVALEGDPAFAELAGTASLLSAPERQVFRTSGQPSVQYANGDYRTGMRLPYATGQSWTMTGGPHGWGGSNTPWSSIDLAGGDGRVLAARAGLAYTMCSTGRGWIRVVHDRGYATDYYHLTGNIAANGKSVSEGTFLGYQGTDVSCGGSASGPHVHFGLRQNNAYVPIAEHNLGKWVIQNGSSVYQGSALHGSTRVYAGGRLYNYGALGLTQGVVDTNGGTTLNKRSGPGTGYSVVGSVADGATVSIACSRYGTTHTGRWGTTNLWNRLTDGTWVSDAYLWTGSNGALNGFC